MSHFAHIVDMPAPVEFYDAVHAEMLRRTAGHVDGLVVHVGRSTETGFQVIEVWDSRESFERADREIVGPIMAELATHTPAGQHALTAAVQEFSPRGLVVPAQALAV